VELYLLQDTSPRILLKLVLIVHSTYSFTFWVDDVIQSALRLIMVWPGVQLQCNQKLSVPLTGCHIESYRCTLCNSSYFMRWTQQASYLGNSNCITSSSRFLAFPDHIVSNSWLKRGYSCPLVEKLLQMRAVCLCPRHFPNCLIVSAFSFLWQSRFGLHLFSSGLPWFKIAAGASWFWEVSQALFGFSTLRLQGFPVT